MMAAVDSIVNKTFTNFDDGVDFIQSFLNENHHPCKHGSRTTVQQYNRKIRAADLRITDKPGDAVYSLRWICKHFGAFKSRGTENAGKHRNRMHYTRGCQFFVYISWDKVQGLYKIKSANLQHSHDIGPELYRLYVSNR